MTPLLGVFFIPYRTSIIHPTLWHWTRKHRHRRLTCAEAERCRAAASLGGEHLSLLAQSAKAHPPQSLLSERRPDTAEPLQRQQQIKECPLLCK